MFISTLGLSENMGLALGSPPSMFLSSCLRLSSALYALHLLIKHVNTLGILDVVCLLTLLSGRMWAGRQ
jgi:hypothetical protein